MKLSAKDGLHHRTLLAANVTGPYHAIPSRLKNLETDPNHSHLGQAQLGCLLPALSVCQSSSGAIQLPNSRVQGSKNTAGRRTHGRLLVGEAVLGTP
jgi:hypothetical protein